MNSYKSLCHSLIHKYKHLLDTFPRAVDRFHNLDILIAQLNGYIFHYSYLLKSVFGYMDLFEADDIDLDGWWGDAKVSSIRIGGVPNVRFPSNHIITYDKTMKVFRIYLPMRLESINIKAKYTARAIGIPFKGNIEGTLDYAGVDIHIEIDFRRKYSKLLRVENLFLGKLSLKFRHPPIIDRILNSTIKPMEHLDKEKLLIAIKNGLKIFIQIIDKILKETDDEPLSHAKLSDLIRNLDFSKDKAELLGSRQQQRIFYSMIGAYVGFSRSHLHESDQKKKILLPSSTWW